MADWDLALVAVAGGTGVASVEQRRRQQRSVAVSLALQVGLAVLMAAALNLAPPLAFRQPAMRDALDHRFAFLDVPLPAPAAAPLRVPLKLPPSHPPARPTVLNPDPSSVLRAPAASSVVSNAPALSATVAPLAGALVRTALPVPTVPPAPPLEVHLNTFSNQGAGNLAAAASPGGLDGVDSQPGAAVAVVTLGAFGASQHAANTPAGPIGSVRPEGMAPGGFGAVTGAAGEGSTEATGGAVHLDQFRRAAPVEANTIPAAAPVTAFTPPQVTYLPQPHYPAEARAEHREGDVVLRVRLGASGAINVVGVVASLGAALDQAAVLAARQLQFHPAQRNGQAVDWTVLVRIHFRLAD
ncbi:MAG TPA: energy transducer TonB [Terriglobales bacterium]|nr:energy transducer TonB [Terriglobales bacterium]